MPAQRARLTSASGDLGRLDAALRTVTFAASAGSLTLHLPGPGPVLLVRRGRTHRLGAGPVAVALEPGDALIAAQFRFEAADGPP